MIDARGYSCPMPVVMLQKQVSKTHPQQEEILVDSQTCVENVTRFAQNNGYTVSVTAKQGDFLVSLTKQSAQ